MHGLETKDASHLAKPEASRSTQSLTYKERLMPHAFLDLLFWIVAFVALFFLFRWLQARKNRKQAGEDD